MDSSNPISRIVRCPACGKSSEFSPRNPFRPFCSQRCRTLDLGDWADGRFRVPVESQNLSETDLELLEKHLADAESADPKGEGDSDSGHD